MVDVKETLRLTVTVLAAGILYALLNWIPFLGSFAVGLFTGYFVGGGFKRGFKLGVYAAAFGTVIITYFILNYGFNLAGVSSVLLLFILWALLVWNILGIALAGLGGGLAAFGRDLHSLIPDDLRKIFSPPETKPGVDYIICPNCGQGNVASACSCIGCTNPLR